MPPTPNCASALKPGCRELGCTPTGLFSWSCFSRKLRCTLARWRELAPAPMGPRYPFEHMQHPEGTPDVGPGTDGKRKASHTLEVLCTFEKAEGVFSPQRRDYTSNLFMP